jgi:predicted DNA-binding WGR domain protein
MRIYLQIPAKDNHAPRFVQLILQNDLLGGCTLIKESGQQGQRGRSSRNHFNSQNEAVTAMEEERNLQIKRGYQVMFVQGIA